MSWLQRKATADRGAGTVTLRGYDFDRPTDDLRLFDFQVEVDAGGGTVDISVLGELDWSVVKTGLGSNESVKITTPGHAIRAVWTGGSGGSVLVYASPKFNGAV